mgnify:CR=1 FL=1
MPRSKPLAGRCILVLEDEPLVAMLLQDLLLDLGTQVAGPVSSLPEAVALLAQGGIAGALLDVNLRGTMSYPLADALRAEGVPFLFVTGYGPEDLDPAFRDDPLIRKPIDVRRFQEMVTSVISRDAMAG